MWGGTGGVLGDIVSPTTFSFFFFFRSFPLKFTLAIQNRTVVLLFNDILTLILF
jgi:hypothetical protein